MSRQLCTSASEPVLLPQRKPDDFCGVWPHVAAKASWMAVSPPCSTINQTLSLSLLKPHMGDTQSNFLPGTQYNIMAEEACTRQKQPKQWTYLTSVTTRPAGGAILYTGNTMWSQRQSSTGYNVHTHSLRCTTCSCYLMRPKWDYSHNGHAFFQTWGHIYDNVSKCSNLKAQSTKSS